MLGDLCGDYCNPTQYCILKEFLTSMHPSPRLLIQLKCIEKFKYEMNKDAKEELPMGTVIIIWAEEGYAERFANEYNEDDSYKEIYERIMKKD